MTERAPHFAGEAQERLIEKLCGRADELVAEARSSGEAAEQLKELCDQFERVRQRDGCARCTAVCLRTPGEGLEGA